MPKNGKNKAAVQLGKLGGSARSEAKTAAVKEYGAKGGRPHRVEISEEQLAVLREVLSKELDRLTRNKTADPAWSDRLWQKSIDECVDLAQKFPKTVRFPVRVDLKKTELIQLVQLLAEQIAYEENAGNKAYLNKALDAKLTRYHTLAEGLDKFLGQPSILAHYLKESRRRFT